MPFTRRYDPRITDHDIRLDPPPTDAELGFAALAGPSPWDDRGAVRARLASIHAGQSTPFTQEPTEHVVKGAPAINGHRYEPQEQRRPMAGDEEE